MKHVTITIEYDVHGAAFGETPRDAIRTFKEIESVIQDALKGKIEALRAEDGSTFSIIIGVMEKE